MERQHLSQTKNAIASPQTQSHAIARSSTHPIEELQGAIGNRAVNQLLANQPVLQAKPMFGGVSRELVIQPKLTIGAVGDKYEQEADRVAEQVVNQINTTAPRSSTQSRPIQRQEMPEEDDRLQMKPVVQRLASKDGGAIRPDLEASIQQARGRGHPLADSVREPMERAFGADFSRVRVHADATSEALNQLIQAKAFTTGQDVFFRQRAYEPSSRGGQELIAHELAHVVQQNGGAMQQELEEQGETVQRIQAAGLGDKKIQRDGDEVDRYKAKFVSLLNKKLKLISQPQTDKTRKEIRELIDEATALRMTVELEGVKAQTISLYNDLLKFILELEAALPLTSQDLVPKSGPEPKPDNSSGDEQNQAKQEEFKPASFSGDEQNQAKQEEFKPASSSRDEQNQAKKSEERKEYEPDKNSAINKDIAALTLEVGDSPEHGVKWKRDLRGWFGYKIDNETTYKASRLEKICPPGVAHSELWWANRGIQLPKYIAQELDPHSTGNEYVYHLTDRKWLESIRAGFKSTAARNSGRKIAEATGSTQVFFQKKLKDQITAKISFFLKELLLNDQQNLITLDYFNLAIDIIKKTTMDNILPHAISVFEEMEGVDEDRDSDLIDTNDKSEFEPYKQQVSDKLPKPEQTPTAKSKSTVTVNSHKWQDEAKKICNMEHHYLTRLAKNYKVAKNAIEEMVTSQHVYVFMIKGVSEAFSQYGSLKEDPVVIRIPIGAFKFLSKDTQADVGFRSRDEVSGDKIQYYEAVNTEKSEKFKKKSDLLKDEWYDNQGWKKEERWKALPNKL